MTFSFLFASFYFHPLHILQARKPAFCASPADLNTIVQFLQLK